VELCHCRSESEHLPMHIYARHTVLGRMAKISGSLVKGWLSLNGFMIFTGYLQTTSHIDQRGRVYSGREVAG
jgi:hypothetical protein